MTYGWGATRATVKKPLEGVTVPGRERGVGGLGNGRCEEAADGDGKTVCAFGGLVVRVEGAVKGEEVREEGLFAAVEGQESCVRCVHYLDHGLEAMMAKRVDPRRAQVAQAGLKEASGRRRRKKAPGSFRHPAHHSLITRPCDQSILQTADQGMVCKAGGGIRIRILNEPNPK